MTINGVFFPAPTNGNFIASQEFPAGTTDFYHYATGTSTGQVGSGQTWTSAHPWSWNAPGVDYPVGLDNTLTLKNPVTNPPPNCVYNVNGSGQTGGNPVLLCTGSDLNISGYEFGINAAAGFPSGVSGYGGCLVLEIGQNSTGTATVENNDFPNGPGCTNTQILGTIANSTLTVTTLYWANHNITIGINGASGKAGKVLPNTTNSGTAGIIFADNAYDVAHGTTSCNVGAGPVPCTGTGGVGTYGLTSAINTASSQMVIGGHTNMVLFDGPSTNTGAGQYNIIFAYNTLHGWAKPTDTECGGVPCTDGGVGTNTTTGAKTIVFNAFIDTPGRPLNGGHYGISPPVTGLPLADYIDANYFEGIAENPFTVHGEVMEETTATGITVPIAEYGFNTILLPNLQSTTVDNTTIIYNSTGSIASPLTMHWGDVENHHNLMILNWASTTIQNSAAAAFQSGYNTTDVINYTSNFIDITGIAPGGGGGTGCFTKGNASIVTSPTWLGNVSLNSGNTLTGYGVAKGSPGCN